MTSMRTCPHTHTYTHIFFLTDSWYMVDYCSHHGTFSSVWCSVAHMLFLEAGLPPCAFSSRPPDLISSLMASFHIWVDLFLFISGFHYLFISSDRSVLFPLENVFKFVTMLSLMRFINQSLPSSNLLGCVFCGNSSLFYPNAYSTQILHV